MFHRFTEQARQVVVLAQKEACALKHHYIGTEHILLGLLREEEGLGARVLERLDITVEGVRALVVLIAGSGEEVSQGQLPFTPRAKNVLDLALREALSLGHNHVDTEHILLGLARLNEGLAARVLLELEADSEKIRNEVIATLSGPGGEAGAKPEPPGTAAVSHAVMGEGASRLMRGSLGMSALACSFCTKRQDQVKKLILGPDVYICDECVDLCQQIIDEELGDAEDAPARAQLSDERPATSENQAMPAFQNQPTPRVLSVFETSEREAKQYGHRHIGTHHLLLGLLAEPDGIAAMVLRDLGVADEAARRVREIIERPRRRG